MRAMLFEPNPVIADVLKKAMRNARIDVDCITDEEDVATLIESDVAPYAVLIVGSISGPDEAVVGLRRRGVATPVIVLSDVRNADLAVRCFGAGADDFLVKPFNPAEFRARVHAVTRRMGGRAASSFKLGDLTVFEDGRDPEVDGKRIKLSHREHAIFHYLARHQGRVVSKEAVYEAVYGSMNCEPFDKVIDVYICKLRKKLADATGGKQFIETVYCRGYKLDKPENTIVQRLGGGRKAA